MKEKKNIARKQIKKINTKEQKNKLSKVHQVFGSGSQRDSVNSFDIKQELRDGN